MDESEREERIGPLAREQWSSVITALDILEGLLGERTCNGALLDGYVEMLRSSLLGLRHPDAHGGSEGVLRFGWELWREAAVILWTMEAATRPWEAQATPTRGPCGCATVREMVERLKDVLVAVAPADHRADLRRVLEEHGELEVGGVSERAALLRRFQRRIGTIIRRVGNRNRGRGSRSGDDHHVEETPVHLAAGPSPKGRRPA